VETYLETPKLNFRTIRHPPAHEMVRFAKCVIAQCAAITLLPLLLLLFSAVTTTSAQADFAYAWGSNLQGQLGDGTRTVSTVPIPVTTLTSGVTAVSVNGYFSLAVRNGGVYAWGDNSSNELGIATSASHSNTPLPVPSVSSGVTAVAAGNNFSLAIQNGGVRSWGYNGFGNLGNGTNIGTFAGGPPASVTSLSSGVTAIAAGYGHGLAIQQGALYAWGYNRFGQLGDGTHVQHEVPVAVPGLSNGVTAVAAGSYNSVAIQNGAVYEWGLSGGSLPVRLDSLPGSATAVASGAGHILSLTGGNVYAWGRNNYGQLGDGTTTNQDLPAQVDPTDLHDIVAIAAAANSSYALCADGSLWDWGYNAIGDLGLGTTTISYLRPQHLLPPPGYLFASISAGESGEHVVASLIPEPSSLFVLALGALALLTRPQCRSVPKLNGVSEH
jgi:alpha-tubulin suppressor-like RCC1 family protein